MVFFNFHPPFGSSLCSGPVTHLYLGELYCNARSIEDPAWIRDFLRGTLFPDIQYIGHISRERTHPQVSHLDEVDATEDPFEAGMKFHAWVDIKREAFVEASGIYALVASCDENQKAKFLKFIEEELLADLYDGRGWLPIFDEVAPEQRQFGLSDEIIWRWHNCLTVAIRFRPSWYLWGTSYYQEAAIGLSNDTLYNWSYLLVEHARDPLFQNHVDALIDHLCRHF